MRTSLLVAAVAAAMALFTPLSAQQQPVVSQRELDAALGAGAQRLEAERAVVTRVLSRAEVEEIAKAQGWADRLGDARTAVGQLNGMRLERASEHARALEQALAGGGEGGISYWTWMVVLVLAFVLILILFD
jgi:hypothetical protein